MRRGVSRKALLLAAYCVLLVSRILVLTESYTWPIDPVKLELAYLALTVFLALTAREGKFRIAKSGQIFVLAVLLVHTLLWGLLFVNQSFADIIANHFKSQIMFVVILIVTVLSMYQLGAAREFLKCCYYTLSAMLIYYFLKNISELDLSNLANIMTVSDRTRASFGFGHYNTLGGACVCNLMLWDTLRKEPCQNAVKFTRLGILLVTMCMLLASASRSSLTSLVLYVIVFNWGNMENWRISRKTITLIKVLLGVLISIMVVWAFFQVDTMSLLALAQRGHLVSETLPLFFESGRIWTGLGYASNTHYGDGLTPYLTYWLDNAYIYYLVTTGIVGLVVIMSAALVLWRGIRSRRTAPYATEMIAVFVVYAYNSLFEATMFSSGAIINYIYLPWFLLFISEKTAVPPKKTP